MCALFVSVEYVPRMYRTPEVMGTPRCRFLPLNMTALPCNTNNREEETAKRNGAVSRTSLGLTIQIQIRKRFEWRWWLVVRLAKQQAPQAPPSPARPFARCRARLLLLRTSCSGRKSGLPSIRTNCVPAHRHRRTHRENHRNCLISPEPVPSLSR